MYIFFKAAFLFKKNQIPFLSNALEIEILHNAFYAELFILSNLEILKFKVQIYNNFTSQES